MNFTFLVEHHKGFIDVIFYVLTYGRVGNERNRRPNVFHDAKLERATDARFTCWRILTRSRSCHRAQCGAVVKKTYEG